MTSGTSLSLISRDSVRSRRIGSKMSPSHIPSPKELRKRARKLLNSGNLREAGQALVGASEAYRKLGKSDLARRLKFEGSVFSAVAELANALLTGNFDSVLKESRKLKKASERDDDNKRFAQYFETLVTIGKNLVERRTQVAITSLARLEQNLRKLPIRDPDF